MFNILVALMLGSGDVEARHNRGNRNHHRHAQHQSSRPARPPAVVVRNVYPHRYKNHWVYPHHRSGFIWKWMPGHFNRRGVWTHGRWTVVLRF
jgi:hypothetical protein